MKRRLRLVAALTCLLAAQAFATLTPAVRSAFRGCGVDPLPPAFVEQVLEAAATHPNPDVRTALRSLTEADGLHTVVCAWEATSTVTRKVNDVADAHMKRKHPGLRWKRIRTYQKTSEDIRYWFVLYRSIGDHVEEVEVCVDTRTWTASE